MTGRVANPIDLTRLRARDPELLKHLIEKYSPRIWVAIRPFARDDDHADDLLQECWIRIVERVDRFSQRGSFASGQSF